VPFRTPLAAVKRVLLRLSFDFLMYKQMYENRCTKIDVRK
jgi:hypothetical protein